jgi:UDP:flavonoid glycosyltransferase YjiC (YdhE family)
VAVCLGGTGVLTLLGAPFVRHVLRAFEAFPDTEVIAPVPASFREEIGALPGHVRLVDPVPLHLLLGGCDAMVHQGGSGTTMTATAFGLPQLVLPQLADHFGYGDRIAALGAGVTLESAGEQDDLALLQEALATLLGEPGLRKAARELARLIGRMPPPSRVVSGLERLAAGDPMPGAA